MRIALATSLTELPPSDKLLQQALEQRGVETTAALWSGPEVDWQRFDAVAVRSCWDYHLRLEEFLGWLSHLENSGVEVLNQPDLIRWNTNKLYLKELSGKQIRIPETIWIAAGETIDLTQLCASQNWRSAVVKPLVSASAHGTERRGNGSVTGPMMVQKYLDAIEREGEWSLMYFGCKFSHAVRKLPLHGDFRVQSEFGGTLTPAIPTSEALAFAAKALAQAPLAPAMARMDIIDTGEGFALMEMEVIEPELFLDQAPGSQHVLAQMVLESLVATTAK